MKEWIFGILTLIAVVIIATRLGVDSSTAGEAGGEALAYTFDALINFFGGLFGGISDTEAVG